MNPNLMCTAQPQIKGLAVDLFKILLGTTTMCFGEVKASRVSHLLGKRNHNKIPIPMASNSKGRLLTRRFKVLLKYYVLSQWQQGFWSRWIFYWIFHKAWLVVQNEVVAAVDYFFSNEF